MPARPRLSIAALILGLALVTVYSQFRGLIPIAPAGDPHAFVDKLQVARTYGTLRGVIGDPWQYRVGSEALAWVALQAARGLGIHGAGVAGFLSFRALQNVAIFALAWLLYRRIAGRFAAAVGLGLVAWALTQSYYHSGLAFDTYGDVIVYRAAGVLIVQRRYAWVVPLTIVGTINRETCGLVPLMLLATAVSLGTRTPEGRRAAQLGALALVGWAVTYGVIRLVVGPGMFIPPAPGKSIGLDVLGYNVTRGVTWENLFRTWTIVPLLAAWQWRRWPAWVRDFAIAVVPIWLVAHFFAAIVAETRLMLVPYVLVFVPGALAAFYRAREPVTVAA